MGILFRKRIFNWQFVAALIVEIIAVVIVKLVTGLF